MSHSTQSDVAAMVQAIADMKQDDVPVAPLRKAKELKTFSDSLKEQEL